MSKPPMVMVFSGTDPSGGAGMQADILTLSCLGVHPLSVVTSVTVQDTVRVSKVIPMSPQEVLSQARQVLDDIPAVVAFKIGLVGSAQNADVLTELFCDYPHIPVVLDPVLAAGNGDVFADQEWLLALRRLLPRVTVLTPNVLEAARLLNVTDYSSTYPLTQEIYQSWASQLQAWGARYVLITGTHDTHTVAVLNRLYAPSTHSVDGEKESNVDVGYWPRLPDSYHGSGCTLASAIAGYLARGLSVQEAVRYAQTHTWVRLKSAFYPGRGQALPGMFSRQDIEKYRIEYTEQIGALGYETSQWQSYFAGIARV